MRVRRQRIRLTRKASDCEMIGKYFPSKKVSLVSGKYNEERKTTNYTNKVQQYLHEMNDDMQLTTFPMPFLHSTLNEYHLESWRNVKCQTIHDISQCCCCFCFTSSINQEEELISLDESEEMINFDECEECAKIQCNTSRSEEFIDYDSIQSEENVDDDCNDISLPANYHEFELILKRSTSTNYDSSSEHFHDDSNHSYEHTTSNDDRTEWTDCSDMSIESRQIVNRNSKRNHSSQQPNECHSAKIREIVCANNGYLLI
ncbi:hypothetical protein SNEBB_005949 [Seison nebaliae]|nr:hypothetical protein SNEBB_005949 [Seison nebaliae]